MKFTIDPETLREVPDEYEAWTRIGVAARMLGELDLAERALLKALELRPSTAARLRLAHVFQWQGRFEEAHAEFAACLATGEMADFVHSTGASATATRAGTPRRASTSNAPWNCGRAVIPR